MGRKGERRVKDAGNDSVTSVCANAAMLMADPIDPLPDRTPLGRARSLAASACNTVRLSRALVAAKRQIDLAGLDGVVGLLCAKALDLPPEQGRSLGPDLAALMREIDRLRDLIADAAVMAAPDP
jgi:hypothetical protein